MAKTLVICLGNQARGDDAVAREVFDLLEGRLDEEATRLSLHALDVVLAEQVAAVSLVVFVDAERRGEPPVLISSVDPCPVRPDAHILDASGLLALASSLYGHAPPGIMVTVAAPHMDHGKGLSDEAKQASVAAADVVEQLVLEGH